MDTGQMKLRLALNLQMEFLTDLGLINEIYIIIVITRKKENGKLNNNKRKEKRHINPSSANSAKCSNTQTIRRKFADKLFECV